MSKKWAKNKHKPNNKIVSLNASILTLTLNANNLSTQIVRIKTKRNRTSYILSTRNISSDVLIQVDNKRMEEICHANTNHKKAMTMLMLGKDFVAKNISKDKKR